MATGRQKVASRNSSFFRVLIMQSDTKWDQLDFGLSILGIASYNCQIITTNYSLSNNMSHLLTAFLMQAFFSVFIGVEFWQRIFTSLSPYFLVLLPLTKLIYVTIGGYHNVTMLHKSVQSSDTRTTESARLKSSCKEDTQQKGLSVAFKVGRGVAMGPINPSH